jgi:hypothetical protein
MVDPVAGQEPSAETTSSGPASISDAPGLVLIPAELKVVMRAPREPSDGLIRVTGYRSMDYETGMTPAGESAVLNRVVELPEGEEEVLVTLPLASQLYYQASFGPGEIPQAGDWMGPMTQWLGKKKFFLLVGNMKIE